MKIVAKYFSAMIIFTICGCGVGAYYGPARSDAVELNIDQDLDNVASNSAFSVVFNAPVDITTVTNETFYLAVDTSSSPSITTNGDSFKNATDVPEQTVGCSDNTHCENQPSSPLDPGTAYILHLTNGIRYENPDDDGLFEGFEITFTTAGSVTVTLSPLDDATGVAVDAAVTATFSGAITEPSDWGEIFSLVESGGNTNLCDADNTSYDETTMVVTCAPDVDLGYETEYTLSVSGVEDALGVEIADASSTFTTVSEGLPENAAASVSFTDTDYTLNEIVGTASITKATIEDDVTSYVLYWGSDEDTKLAGQDAITTIPKTGSDLTYTFDSATAIPAGATHFIVFTNNANGEMISGTSCAIAESADITPPTPGNSGIITAADIEWTTLTLNWTKATDDHAAQSALQYKIVRGEGDEENDIDTVANAEANGILITDWTTNIDTTDVTGLANNTAYFFTVIVKDAEGNKTVYTALEQQTDGPN